MPVNENDCLQAFMPALRVTFIAMGQRAWQARLYASSWGGKKCRGRASEWRIATFADPSIMFD
jgi:hypothetical protein